MATDPFYDGLAEDEVAAGDPEELVEMLAVEKWPPPYAELVCEFVIVGEPKPAGSKTSGVATRKDKKTGRRVPIIGPSGLPKTFTKDSSGKAGKTWRNDVTDAGLRYRRIDEPLDGRLAAEFVFVFPYTPADYSKRDGLLRNSIRVAPHVRPDALKLARAVEDALSSIVWTDDSRITEERIRKVHVAKDKGPMRCEVRVWRLPTTWGELRDRRLPGYVPDELADEAPQRALL